MNPKPLANQRQVIAAYRTMSAEQKLRRVFEMTAFSRELVIAGLRSRFPDADDRSLQSMSADRASRCWNQSY